MLLPWLSLLVGSALPLIVWRELTHTALPVSLLLGRRPSCWPWGPRRF
jgi:hypothetical protein